MRLSYQNFPTSSAEVLTKHHLPLLSPRLPSSVTAAATGISRTDHGAFTVRKSQPPPSRNPRSDSWSRFSWRNVLLVDYEKHNTGERRRLRGSDASFGDLPSETALIFTGFQNFLRQKAADTVSGHFGRRTFWSFIKRKK